MLLIIILILAFILLYWFNKKRKKISVAQVNLITGAPKTMKTGLCVHLAKKDYNKRVRKTKLSNFFRKLLKKPLLEMPLFYSTIPLNFPYVPLTEEILERATRPRFNSVLFFDEAYLVADSMAFGDADLNTSFSMFNKLIGHELHGGSLWYNTQNVHDCHFAVKRCATNYIYIPKKPKNLPFFVSLKCRELVNSEEVSIVNTSNEDLESDPSFHTLLIPKSIFKKYDPYAYSVLTDDLPVEDNVVTTKYLKTNKVISMQDIIKKRKESKKNEKTK